MKLSVLLGHDVTPDPEITGLGSDSRKVASGHLFTALAGSKLDGGQFLTAAAGQGAAAMVVAKGAAKPELGNHIAWVEHDNPRRLLSEMAARFYSEQPRRIAAVTGTNGKTSTVTFAYQLWQRLDINGAALGTLGIQGNGVAQSGSMTTPDPVALHEQLATMAKAGITHLAMEASSHGLAQHRLDGVRVSAAAFTNLTRDHLDYHTTMDSYRDAKFRLFTDVLAQDGIAVVNADAPEADRLLEVCAARQLSCWTYGMAGHEIKLIERTPLPQGQKLALDFLGRRVTLTLKLVGAFQAMNVLCAAGLVAALDRQHTDAIIDALPRLTGVPGRLQPVPGHKQGAAVYVDYAHTPDALENILTALRPHAAKRLICVFGCGGDRDAGKRPVMAGIAARLADLAIVTDDNPRSEEPAAIRQAVLSGAPDAREIGDRRAAIQEAIRLAEAGDIVVIAGKGHEQGQIFADRIDPFDDVTEAHSAMQEAS